MKTENRRSRNRRLTTGLALAGLGLASCEAPKESGASKTALFENESSSKSGTAEAVMAAQLLTAVVEAGASKDVSSVSVGETVNGSLSQGDDQMGDGSYYDAWRFTLASPQVVRVRMSSSDFDTYLKLYQGSPGGLGADLGSDDDGGGGTDSELSTSLGAGTYTILANSYSAGGTGSYSLAVSGSAASGSGSGGGSMLSAGQSASGELTASDPTLQDGTHYDVWTYYGEAGELVTVTLTSDDVDTYLVVLSGTAESGESLGEDDDGGGGTNSQVSVRLPATGQYTFLANTYGEGETGAYTISLTSTPSVPIEERFVTNGPSNGRYALLVGIDDYPGTGSDLRGPVEDARIMERVLVDRFGFDPRNVVTLNDSDATRENIANGIVHHLGNAGSDGVAVFFYSGHGTQIGENIGVSAPVDPEPRGEGDEAIYIYGSGGESSVILDEELGYLIETIGAGRTLVVVDACFSGEITRASGDAPQSKVVSLDDPEVAAMVELPTRFINSEVKALGDMSDLSLGFGNFQAIANALSNPQRHIMWGASTEDQVSWTSGLGNGASVFTYFMGERMMSAPTSSTFSQVQQQVHGDVVEYIEGNGNMTMQNPQMRGSNAGMTMEAFFRQR